MDPVALITQPIITPAPAISVPAAQPSAAVASSAVDQVDLSIKAATQAAQPKAQDIANPNVLGNGTFAMFTVNGRLYTRFTSVNNGIIKVTYVPQQPGISLGNSGSSIPSLLDIQA